SRAPTRSGVFHRRSDHLGRPAMKRLLILAMTAAAPALAQLQFFIVDNTGEWAAQPVVDLGSLYANEKITLNSLLRNTSTSPVQVTTLTLAGAAFTLSAPPVPITLGSQSALTISVSFQSADAGKFNAKLRSAGVSIILTATVLPRLTLTGSFDFGSVVRGSSAQRIFTISNQTQQTIIAPGISVGAGDFAVSGNSPSGQALAPQLSATFAIVFT